MTLAEFQHTMETIAGQLSCIIYIYGPTSSGKSSIARAMQTYLNPGRTVEIIDDWDARHFKRTEDVIRIYTSSDNIASNIRLQMERKASVTIQTCGDDKEEGRMFYAKIHDKILKTDYELPSAAIYSFTGFQPGTRPDVKNPNPDYDWILQKIITEMNVSVHAHGIFHSLHEAHSVKEEDDELWDVIKNVGKMLTPKQQRKRIREEAVQVAAMCMLLADQFGDKLDD